MKSNYVLNKTTNVNPIDRNKIYIEVNYDNESIINQPFPQVGIKNLKFGREDVNTIYSCVTNANEGIFYAPTLDIELTKGANSYTVPLYIDLTDGFEYSESGIEASVKLYMSLDWLNDRVDAWTFESVVNGVQNGDYPNTGGGSDVLCYATIMNGTFYIPYVISTLPQYVHAFLGVITTVTQGMMVIKEIDVIASIFAPGAASIFSSIPIFIGFIIHVAYILLLIVTLLTNILMFVFAIIQPVKYHAAILMKDLLLATCQELGLAFQSSAWNSYPLNQIALLPEKYVPVANGATETFNISGIFNLNFIVGGYIQPTPSKQQGFPIMTGGDLLRLAKKFMNGKIIIQEVSGVPTLILERRDYNPSTPKYQMPNIRQDWNGYNTKEFFATTIISFTKDLNDKNTFDQYQGQKLSAVVTPTNQPDPLLVLTKGLREITIDAARGVRKESLDMPEVFINDFSIGINVFVNTLTAIANGVISALNAIVGIVNGVLKVLHTLGVIKSYTPVSPVGYINPLPTTSTGSNNRIGMLKMETDLVNVAKLLMVDTAGAYTVNGQKVMKLHQMNSSIVNAQYCFNAFYCIDSWVPVGTFSVPVYTDTQGNGCVTPSPANSDKGKHNQYTLWQPANNHSSDKNKLSLGFDDFDLLFNDINFEDYKGNPLIVDSLAWYLENSYADLQYRKNEIYATNINIVITLPNGE